MDKQSGYIELTRVIMAKRLGVPPDDIDMSAIFGCAIRAIEEKVDSNLDEFALAPRDQKELEAVVGLAGGVIVPMMFSGEYPFDGFVSKYESWYEENLVMEFLKMKLASI